MAWIEPSKYQIQTGEGIFADVEVNLIDIIRRAVDSDHSIYTRMGTFNYIRINPDALSSVDTPAFYVWTDGSEESSDSAGGLRNESVSVKESIYCTVKFLDHGPDQVELAKNVKYFGNFIKQVINQNLNLNDLMNQKADVKGIDFLPTPIQTGSNVVLAQGFTIPVIYKRTKRNKQSQR